MIFKPNRSVRVKDYPAFSYWQDNCMPKLHEVLANPRDTRKSEKDDDVCLAKAILSMAFGLTQSLSEVSSTSERRPSTSDPRASRLPESH
jgi:hypothetical protein